MCAVHVLALLMVAQGLKIPERTFSERVLKGQLVLAEISRGTRGESQVPGPDDPAALVTNDTDRSVTFTRWYGRAGNNIVQILNAILFGQSKGYSRLRLPNVHVNPRRPASTVFDLFNLPEEITIKRPLSKLNLDCNWNPPHMRFFFGRCLAVNKSLYRETLRRHLVPFMSPSFRRACRKERNHPFDGLTVHLRSGDTKRNRTFTQSRTVKLDVRPYTYASCVFFERVLADRDFRSVRIITEPDMSHPCISVLKQKLLGVSLQVQSRSIEDDACAIINAKHLAVGSWSTFSQVLELFNSGLETNFWPSPPLGTMKMGTDVCVPVPPGTSKATYVYQVDGMEGVHNNMLDASGAGYFAALPLQNVTLRSVCDEQAEVPFAGSIR